MESGFKIIKIHWKYRIIFGIISSILFVIGLIFIDYLIDGNLQIYKSYVFQGIFYGLFMSIGFFYFSEKFLTKIASFLGDKIKPSLTTDEKIEMEGGANLFRGMEGVGGKLFLTNKKIIFASHKFNIQRGETIIEFQDIAEITERKTAKLIDNGIRIKTKNEQKFDFVVNDRNQWMQELLTVCN